MSCFGCVFGCFKCLLDKCIKFWKKLFGFGKSKQRTQILAEKCTQTMSPPQLKVPGRENLRVGFCDNLHLPCCGRDKVIQTFCDRSCVPAHYINHRHRRKRARRRGIVYISNEKMMFRFWGLTCSWNEKFVKGLKHFEFLWEQWFLKFSLNWYNKESEFLKSWAVDSFLEQSWEKHMVIWISVSVGILVVLHWHNGKVFTPLVTNCTQFTPKQDKARTVMLILLLQLGDKLGFHCGNLAGLFRFISFHLLRWPFCLNSW